MSFLADLFGKSCVIYGEPGVGKTYVMTELARTLYEATGYRALFYWSDENLIDSEYGEEVRKRSQAKVIVIRSIDSLIMHIRSQLKRWQDDVKKQKPVEVSMIVIDSITGFFEEEYGMTTKAVVSPYVTAKLSRATSIITKDLTKIARLLRIPTFVITHDTPEFEGEWFGEKRRPAYVRKGLKNTDIWILQTKRDTVVEKEIEENGETKIIREPVERNYWKVLMYRSMEKKHRGMTYCFQEELKKFKKELQINAKKKAR